MTTSIFQKLSLIYLSSVFQNFLKSCSKVVKITKIFWADIHTWFLVWESVMSLCVRARIIWANAPIYCLCHLLSQFFLDVQISILAVQNILVFSEKKLDVQKKIWSSKKFFSSFFHMKLMFLDDQNFFWQSKFFIELNSGWSK